MIIYSFLPLEVGKVTWHSKCGRLADFGESFWVLLLFIMVSSCHRNSIERWLAVFKASNRGSDIGVNLYITIGVVK